MMDTTHAVRSQQSIGVGQLRLEQVVWPVPGDGEALVRVRAVGVNPVGRRFRSILVTDHSPPSVPHTSGPGVAGVVEAVGPGVTGLGPGDEVYGHHNGSHDDCVIAPAATLARKPVSLTFDQAASVPVGATTAWTSLFGEADLQPGQSVLVQDAAGSVGRYAVQFARAHGARVMCSASPDNADEVRRLGADPIVDRSWRPFEEVMRPVDMVVDTVGGDVLQRSWSVVKPGGVLVSVVTPISEQEATRRGVRVAHPSDIPTAELLERFAQMIDAGTLRI